MGTILSHFPSGYFCYRYFSRQGSRDSDFTCSGAIICVLISITSICLFSSLQQLNVFHRLLFLLLLLYDAILYRNCDSEMD